MYMSMFTSVNMLCSSILEEIKVSIYPHAPWNKRAVLNSFKAFKDPEEPKKYSITEVNILQLPHGTLYLLLWCIKIWRKGDPSEALTARLYCYVRNKSKMYIIYLLIILYIQTDQVNSIAAFKLFFISNFVSFIKMDADSNVQ
jgi:hypothetical protein